MSRKPTKRCVRVCLHTFKLSVTHLSLFSRCTRLCVLFFVLFFSPCVVQNLSRLITSNIVYSTLEKEIVYTLLLIMCPWLRWMMQFYMQTMCLHCCVLSLRYSSSIPPQ